MIEEYVVENFEKHVTSSNRGTKMRSMYGRTIFSLFRPGVRINLASPQEISTSNSAYQKTWITKSEDFLQFISLTSLYRDISLRTIQPGCLS